MAASDEADDRRRHYDVLDSGLVTTPNIDLLTIRSHDQPVDRRPRSATVTTPCSAAQRSPAGSALGSALGGLFGHFAHVGCKQPPGRGGSPHPFLAVSLARLRCWASRCPSGVRSEKSSGSGRVLPSRVRLVDRRGRRAQNAVAMGRVSVVVGVVALVSTTFTTGLAAQANADNRPGVAPSDAWSCPATHPIKGNFTTYDGERCIYHVPGGSYYSRTKPERCYASETDARADGCRRSKR